MLYDSADPPRSPRAGLDAALALALALATLGIYAGVSRHDFVNYDDPYYVTENPRVQAGLSWTGLRWAATSLADGNWFPLTWLSHMMDVSIWGLDPGGHHLTSALLHATTSSLLFLLLLTITRSRAPSLLAAALFAWHPQRVESVAWIAERKDVLAGLFVIATIAAYAAYVRRPHRTRYAAVIGLFAAALMAKPMAVTTPVVLLLLDRWPLARVPAARWTALIREKAPLFVMSLAAGLVTLVAQTGVGATASLASRPMSGRVANAALSYVSYVRDAVWPTRLTVFYPFPDTIPPWLSAGAALLLGAVTWGAWRARRDRPWLLCGWLWYVAMLVPVIGLIQVGAQARADRYIYLPSIGLGLIAAWTVATIATRRPRWRVAVWAGTGGAVAAFGVATHLHVGVWRDSITLFEHARRIAPSYTALNNLGEAYAARGDLDRAAIAFDDAARLAPANAAARVNLATALNRIGRVDRAIVEFREAIRLAPTDAAAHAGLGAVLARAGHDADAVAALRAAIALETGHAEWHFNLGQLLTRAGRMDEAAASFREAVRLSPQDPIARANFGAALAQLGRWDDAIEQFTEALRLNPTLDQVRANRDRAIELRAKARRSQEPR